MAVPSAWLVDAVDPVDGALGVSYESDARASVLPVSLGLTGVYVALLALRPLATDGSLGVLTTVITVACAVVAIAVALIAAGRKVDEDSAHPVLALLAVTATLAAFTNLVEHGDPRDTVPFLLLVVALGAVFLHRAWFLCSLAVAWASFLSAAVVSEGGRSAWEYWVFYLLVASVLGGVVHLLRRRSLAIASAAVQRALRAATEDAATGLANRRGLAMVGRELVAVARRGNDAVHCSFVDVDGLKGINDRYGHDAGDDVIAAVAEALRRSSRDSDVVARWGGDEFVVVGLGVGMPVLDLEHRVQGCLDLDRGLAEHLGRVRISVGRAMLEPWDTGDLESLLWSADRDMYVRRALKTRSVPPVLTIDRTAVDDDR